MGVAWAQQAQGQMHTHPGAQDKASASLEAVTITATRRPSAALTAPATVTVIDSQQLQEDLVSDLRTMFRHEPGVAVGRDPRGRGGEAHIEVRGIGSQRLGLMVDGVRQPGGYVAAGASHGQLKLDVRSLSRVEVLKGRHPACMAAMRWRVSCCFARWSHRIFWTMVSTWQALHLQALMVLMTAAGPMPIWHFARVPRKTWCRFHPAVGMSCKTTLTVHCSQTHRIGACTTCCSSLCWA